MSTSVPALAANKYIAPNASQLAQAQKVVARFAEKWDKPDADGLRELMHSDTQNLIPPMTQPADREGVVEHFRQIFKQLPDLRLDVDRWAPTGDIVMVEWTATATVAGKLLSWSGIDRFRIRGDRMDQGMVYWDTRRLAEMMAAAAQAANPEKSR
ncbi:Ketosteroid isomerase-related protein [Collimonas sp. OK242]|jgi:ketosteroid isomerase-like protein|uniref:nuclear transport factor 2 family protein n=1 Tax=Collimonas sp. OK242 TaxID=1798195 RepID=UPI0008964DEA|nr:nuclear transport factor 2 family protein [Collimonas sp. OK242]SDX07591.1 Ketosteroid isomerase-related protein [Collimonas sp. OK242]